jgi:hypothetical protein
MPAKKEFSTAEEAAEYIEFLRRRNRERAKEFYDNKPYWMFCGKYPDRSNVDNPLLIFLNGTFNQGQFLNICLAVVIIRLSIDNHLSSKKLMRKWWNIKFLTKFSFRYFHKINTAYTIC